MKVSIVILTLDNYSDTDECLQSLRKLDYPNYDVVLVDNGSNDGTPARVRARYSNVTVIENETNLGVPAGYNIGFAHGLRHGADAVVMLNNDTVCAEDNLTHMVAAAQREPHAGIVAPVVYYSQHPNEIWSAGARFRPFPPAFVMDNRIGPSGRELSFAIGCCILITRRALEAVGGLDETYFFMWEDLDFSLRVRNAGLKIIQASHARIWHKISRTSRPGSEAFWRMHGESGMVYQRRHSLHPKASAIACLGWFSLREFFLKGRIRFLPAFMRGVKSGWHKPLRPLPALS